jgi:hypothetical protein
MVTAILIPIICIYFYWVTMKDLKEKEKKWISLKEQHEEAFVSGKVVNLLESRKRFYYHKYIHLVDIHIQTETKLIRVKRITPYIVQNDSITIKIGDNVRLYGNWRENEFRFHRYELLNQKV